MKTIDLNQNWRVEHFALNEGLARKAYRTDHEPPADAMVVDLPRTAQAALLDHGRAADPCVGYQSDALKWPEEKEWWYYHDFDSPQHTAGERVCLRFLGITYRAEVWVNGELAGNIEGMFREDELDVTDLLRDSGANRLAVRTRTQEMARQDDRGSDIRGKVRSQGVVMQAMYRWNWVPHLVAVGIWRPVQLLVRGSVEIEEVRARTVSVQAPCGEEAIAETAPATIEISWRIRNSGEAETTVEVAYELAGETFTSDGPLRGKVRVTVPAGSCIWVQETIDLAQARLWWSNGLGEAHLYRITTRLVRGATGVSEQPRTTTFGVREIAFVPNDDAQWVTQVSGHSARPWTMIPPLYDWILSLNGRRVFLKGSNWVHADVLLRLDRERYDRVLRPAKAGGLNFLRVWGGSLGETEEFYDCCDRLGILCWQEFWLACENYPALDRSLLRRCARDTVRRLHNHPSLVFYSGGNEFEPDNPQNRSAVDALAKVVAEEDRHRAFRRSSPYKGDKHGGLVPTPGMMRNKYLDILPGEKRQVLFRSESAVGRSATAFATLERFITRQWPLDEKQFRHFFGVPSEFLGFANEYAADDEFDAAVMANHFAHIRVLQVNLEYCRSQMFRCGGHLNWQYSVPWPCLHREIVDWWGVPKPAFHAYANACKDPALFADLERYLWNPGERVDAGVYLVNDHLTKNDLRCTVEVYGTDGQVHHRQEWSVQAAGNSSRRLGGLDWVVPTALASRSLILLTRIEQGNVVLYRGNYLVAVSNHEHDPGALMLDGDWQRADGSTLTLPGNDPTLGDDGFDSIVLKSLEKDFEQAAEERENVSGEAGTVTYRRKFDLPESLRGRTLELFCMGLEASFSIWVNGQEIASAVLRGSHLDLGAMAHVPHGRDMADARIDPATDYKFFSDPITLPKLTPIFADLPSQVLKEKGNEIVLRLKTDCQKVVSHPLVIRRPTVNRDAVAEHLRRGVLFGDLRRMPAADVSVAMEKGQLSVTNRGAVVAVLVLLDVQQGEEVLAVEDNALFLKPDEKRALAPLGGGTFPDGCRVTVRGWNVPTVEVQG